MRYVTFVAADAPRQPRLGAHIGEWIVDFERARSWAQGAKALSAEPLPSTMLELIHAGPAAWGYTRRLASALRDEPIDELKAAGRAQVGWPLSAVRLLPPLPRPMGVRDFYAFEEHVARARAARGLSVPDAWYQAPAFYFSNPNAAYGHDEMVPIPSYSQAMDYELEVACVIGQPGRDIPAERAGAFIFGYTVFNDWSARDEQRREMQVGLGPAKGKDFASSFGPSLVTPDELEDRATDRTGVYDLAMVARVNGEERSRGRWIDIHFSFAEMIERASADVFLLPGEVLGSGTVGSGSLLEVTGGQGPWLQPGDEVELEIERLGVLRNVVGAGHAMGPSNESD
jgi:fumarylacetoacetate (FAA) hydrolase